MHLKAGDVNAGVNSGKVDVEPVVGPGPELEVAALVVKGEPGDVNLAGRLEDTFANTLQGRSKEDF